MSKKNRKINLLFHAFVLTLAIVIELPRFVDIRTFVGITNYAVSRIFLLVVFYICYFWLVPVYLAKKKILTTAFLLLILLNVITFAGYSILQMVHAATTHNTFHLLYSWKIHFSGLLAMTIAAIFGTVFRIVIGWYDEIHKRNILEEEKLRSELMLLKAQVNPHFLFNTLNNIDSLIYSDQAKASESLIKLSSLLRYVIYDAVKDKVPLQLELEHIEAYIDLQSLRYNKKARIRYEKEGNPNGKMIAPMLFMPFIENAFKHTDTAGIEIGLDIRFSIDENSLEFVCKNHISFTERPLTGGFGLDNVKKRLELQYANRYELHIEQNDPFFSVALKIDLL